MPDPGVPVLVVVGGEEPFAETGLGRRGTSGWERLGLVVTPDRKHGVWLDDPATVLRTF
ncbi:hypothetical protein [Pseudonocardia aurantiaca]|uniref:Alpha/beta hydrolase n=1 Tax=Pseudonocardia aurantiaca TaxID=75290 RepID=A0ABW4FU55_9PSEU